MKESYIKIFGDNADPLGKGFGFKPPKIKFKPPKIKVPKFKAPKIKIKAPKFKAPKIKIKAPKFKAPKIKIKAPKFKAPRLPKLPEFNGSQIFRDYTEGISSLADSAGGLLSTGLNAVSPLLQSFGGNPGLPGSGDPSGGLPEEEQGIDQEQQALDEEEAMLDQELAEVDSSLMSPSESYEEALYGDTLDKGEYGL